jgi:hypothetical protein
MWVWDLVSRFEEKVPRNILGSKKSEEKKTGRNYVFRSFVMHIPGIVLFW